MTTADESYVVKKLSRNDVGDTGTHQAGIVIPRGSDMVSFFPPLDVSTLNPRVFIDFQQTGTWDNWRLAYIYYNGRTLGLNTRNEYRLTGLTPFFRETSAEAGDSLSLGRSAAGRWSIELIKNRAAFDDSYLYETIQLSTTWSMRTRKS